MKRGMPSGAQTPDGIIFLLALIFSKAPPRYPPHHGAHWAYTSDGIHFVAIFLEHFFIFQKNSLHLKMANFSSLKRRSIFTSRKILREKLELHSASKKSLNIAKMVEKRFELPTSTHDLSYEKIRLADCHKIPIFF